MASGLPEQHYDFVVLPRAVEEPSCDCAGPPPPRFVLPPPPADALWATAEMDVCDVVAPYQTCRVRQVTVVPPSSLLHGSPSLSILAALITTSLFLFIALVAGTIFFFKHRRRLLTSRDVAKPSEAAHMLYDDLSLRPRVMTGCRQDVPHIEMAAVKGQQYPRVVSGRPRGTGTVFLYPPPPSLTDDGSERASHMYEEIPYYGPMTPSASYSDSDDDVTETFDDVMCHPADELRQPYTCGRPCGAEAPDVTYVPALSPRNGGPLYHPRGCRPLRYCKGDRRRGVPVSPSRRREDAAMQRKDPYYYSDIVAQHPGDGLDVNAGVAERGAALNGQESRRCPNAPGGDPKSHYGCMVDPLTPSGPSRPYSGRATPLAVRMSPGPFVDLYSRDGADWYRRRTQMDSFRCPGTERGVSLYPSGKTEDSAHRAVTEPVQDVRNGKSDRAPEDVVSAARLENAVFR